MKGTTIVMFIASAWFIIFGIMAYSNKGLSEKMREYLKTLSRKEEYLKFSGIYNISLGVVGLIIAIADLILADNNYIVYVFVAVVLLAGPLQGILSQKYRR